MSLMHLLKSKKSAFAALGKTCLSLENYKGTTRVSRHVDRAIGRLDGRLAKKFEKSDPPGDEA